MADSKIESSRTHAFPCKAQKYNNHAKHEYCRIINLATNAHVSIVNKDGKPIHRLSILLF